MTSHEMNLGRLQQVKALRDTWPSEAGHFTPWLADEKNIILLGDAIGMELEVEAQEKNVGPFRADILCKDTATDHWVLIENQLERTDHSHLGQLITYAAGLHAVTIVWIAERFTDEHRAALDWLNEMTDEDIAFFGLEIELWRIDNSPIAPKFNMVSSPNNWAKSVSGGKTTSSLTPTQELQLEFWASFHEYIQQHGASFKPTKPQPSTWMTIAIGRGGIVLNAIASLWNSESKSYDTNELRAELALHDSKSKTYYAQLILMKEQIENELGEPLIWYNPENKQQCRIYLRIGVDNLHDRNQWPKHHEWLKGKLEALRKVFAHRVKQLDADFPVDDGALP